MIIKVTGEQGTPVELTQTFQPPSKSTSFRLFVESSKYLFLIAARCSYAVENGLVTIDCTGGLEGLVTIQYTFNDQTFTGKSVVLT